MPALLALLPMVAAAGTPTWSQVAATDGWSADATVDTSDAGKVEIHTRTIEGIPCFRASTQVDVPADKLLEVAADVEGAKKWSSAGVTDAALLAKSGDTLEYYQYLDVPGWTMAADRFWFLKSTIQKQGDQIVFQWERLVDGGAHKDKYEAVKTANPSAVEPPVNVGGWTFAGSGPTQVKYHICTDSGGSIPQMVQTAATRKTLPDTVSDLVREAKKRSQ